MLTDQKLRELLAYDLMTGIFTWRVANKNSVNIGDVAGSYSGDGYRKIKIRKRSYQAHRLAWFYVYGEWPLAEIDHINGVRDDNRIANLREATHTENSWNSKKRCNRCYAKGVDVVNGRFRARITAQRKTIHLGCYDTEEEARAAYVAAAEKEFGAFARAE